MQLGDADGRGVARLIEDGDGQVECRLGAAELIGAAAEAQTLVGDAGDVDPVGRRVGHVEVERAVGVGRRGHRHRLFQVRREGAQQHLGFRHDRAGRAVAEDAGDDAGGDRLGQHGRVGVDVAEGAGEIHGAAQVVLGQVVGVGGDCAGGQVGHDGVVAAVEPVGHVGQGAGGRVGRGRVGAVALAGVAVAGGAVGIIDSLPGGHIIGRGGQAVDSGDEVPAPGLVDRVAAGRAEGRHAHGRFAVGDLLEHDRGHRLADVVGVEGHGGRVARLQDERAVALARFAVAIRAALGEKLQAGEAVGRGRGQHRVLRLPGGGPQQQHAEHGQYDGRAKGQSV